MSELNACSEGWININGGLNTTGYALEISGPLPSREFCEEYNAAVGEENWKQHIVSWRQYFKVHLGENGVLYNDALEPFECNRTMAKVIALAEEDKIIKELRKNLAVELAAEHFKGSPLAIQMFATAIWYGSICESGEEPCMEVNGIRFWQVGRNASHEFFMGMKNTVEGVSCFSGSEAYEEPFSYREKESWAGGYYGHC